MTPLWCLYCKLWTYFTPFSRVSIIDLNKYMFAENAVNSVFHSIFFELLQTHTNTFFQISDFLKNFLVIVKFYIFIMKSI